MLSLRSIPYFMLFTTMLLALPVCAYTLEGPRYAPDPVKQAQAEAAAQAQAAAETRAQEQAPQLPRALRPDPQQERAELKALISSGAAPLLVYGGDQYQDFLGCLNCAPYMHISLWNNHGPYGARLSPRSIWSDFFEFGHDKSQLSPWNPYAAKPPVVIDAKGQFYGYLTANHSISPRFANNFSANLVSLHRTIKTNPALWFSLAFKASIPAATTDQAASTANAAQDAASERATTRQSPATDQGHDKTAAGSAEVAAPARPAYAVPMRILQLMPRAPEAQRP